MATLLENENNKPAVPVQETAPVKEEFSVRTSFSKGRPHAVPVYPGHVGTYGKPRPSLPRREL